MSSFIDFKHVKENADFSQILAFYGVDMEGKGTQQKALCPFHDEKTASFSANIPDGKYQCFGCSEKGNVLDFVCAMEDCDLRNGAEKIADICGISLSGRTKKPKKHGKSKRNADQKKEPAKGASSTEAPSDDEKSCTDVLSNKKLGFELNLDPNHEYVKQRIPDPKIVELFGIGFCNRGVMKNRVCIPVHNDDDEIVAYAGRWAGDEIPGDETKYLLPKQFNKSVELFNLNRVLSTNEVVVVEGFFDAVRLHLLGVPVVAIMGSSISDAQIDLLVKRGIKRVIVMMDRNEAGEKATKKVATSLAKQFWTLVWLLPEDEDPDSVCEADLQKLVERYN